jgi:hypothetical protein
MANREPSFPLTAGRPVQLAPVFLAPVFLVPVFLVAVAACALGAWLGAWWVPFVTGAAAAALGRAGGQRRSRARGAVLAAAAGALAGWAIPLWALALDGQPVGATARAIAGLAGLPPYAGVTVAVVGLLAALQVLVGAWLARAVLPRGRAEGEVTENQEAPQA